MQAATRGSCTWRRGVGCPTRKRANLCLRRQFVILIDVDPGSIPTVRLTLVVRHRVSLALHRHEPEWPSCQGTGRVNAGAGRGSLKETSDETIQHCATPTVRLDRPRPKAHALRTAPRLDPLATLQRRSWPLGFGKTLGETEGQRPVCCGTATSPGTSYSSGAACPGKGSVSVRPC
jgi:hypothetical protein